MREAVAIVPEGRRVFSRMTVEENLAMGGFFADRDQYQSRIKWVYELFPRFKHHVAVLQHVTAIGELQRLVGVLLDEEDGHPLFAQLLDGVENLLDDDGRKTSCAHHHPADFRHH